MKKLLALLLGFAMILTFAACDDSEDTKGGDSITGSLTELQDDELGTVRSDLGASSDGGTWAMYWYLCGSDLETDGGFATDDLIEMMDVDLPEGAVVVIQTGGALEWQNDIIDSNLTQRYIYDSDGLTLVDEFDAINMGEQSSFEDFLTFCTENFPADNVFLNFWNHGAGSIGGVAFDELYNDDGLNLMELEQGMANVFGDSPSEPPINIVGFDACLMATVDTAAIFSDYAEYMIASEDLEPGGGWEYTTLTSALAQNLSPYELAVEVCDSYYAYYESFDYTDELTLSVLDLSNIPNLVEAYNNFGEDALSYATSDPTFFTEFAKFAESAEHYGGNTRETGYTNMVDMGHLAQNASEYLPQTADDLLTAIDETVVYNVTGGYRENSYGISCYHMFDGDSVNLAEYSQIAAAPAFDYFYNYALTGYLPDEGMEYLYEEIAYEEETLPDLITLSDAGWDDHPLEITDDGFALLNLGPSAYDLLASLTFELYYVDEAEDFILSLGTDNDIDMYWEEGLFFDNFRGVWGSIDGALCYMEIVYEGESYNEYSVPILLNDEEYNLSVIYDYDFGEYYILGARRPTGESGAADKDIRELHVGDMITTIHYGATMTGDDDFMAIPVDTIEVTEDTTFYETDLGDGDFVMSYVMEDYQGYVSYSEYALFEVIDGEIYTSLYE